MHNEIRDFYAHMALTHERRFARCFCRDSGNIAQRYFLRYIKSSCSICVKQESDSCDKGLHLKKTQTQVYTQCFLPDGFFRQKLLSNS